MVKRNHPQERNYRGQKKKGNNVFKKMKKLFYLPKIPYSATTSFKKYR